MKIVTTSTVLDKFFEDYHAKFHFPTNYVPISTSQRFWYTMDFSRCLDPEKLQLAIDKEFMDTTFQNQFKRGRILKTYRDLGGKLSAKEISAEDKPPDYPSEEDKKQEKQEIEQLDRMEVIFKSLDAETKAGITQETKLRMLDCKNPLIVGIAKRKRIKGLPKTHSKYVKNREKLWTTASQVGDADFMTVFPNSFCDIPVVRNTEAEKA